jgi:hypothetical protein
LCILHCPNWKVTSEHKEFAQIFSLLGPQVSEWQYKNLKPTY